METITIISITVAAVLGGILWSRYMEIRRLAEELKWQRDANMQLLKQGAAAHEEKPEPEPLTVERITDALRVEGFSPEVNGDWVSFTVQGEKYHIDASRLPLLFVMKGYSLNPDDWEMDLLREAAHRMSDDMVMVKASFTDDDKGLRYFVVARDRNYESFRSNIASYVNILEDGQRVMDEAYMKMVTEKHDAARDSQSILPPVRQKNKVLS